MTRLEIDEEKAFVRHVKARGYKAEKLMRASERGFPDRTVLLPNGRTLFIEMKRPDSKGELSPQQIRTLADMETLGHWAYVCESADEAIDIFEAHLVEALAK